MHRPGDLLDGWRATPTIYRVNGLSAFVSPTVDKRRTMEILARHAAELGMTYAFTLHAGASLIGPHTARLDRPTPT